MPNVVFVDTSVLCNLLPVPGFDQNAGEVREQMSARLKHDESLFILLITTVIETGNHIAQIKNGDARRRTAERFSEMLDLIIKKKAPWTLHDIAWNKTFLEMLMEGAGTGTSYVDHASARVGTGDLCILTECEQYRQRTKMDATIWSLDQALAAYGV